MSELIAEARVLVTPDTTKFRALLTAELAAATKGVTVPVQITPVAAGAVSASRALAVERAAQANVERELAGASDASAAAASRMTQAARLEATAAKQLAVAQEEVLSTTTALGTAQTRAARAAAALATARRAEAALTRADTAETAQNTAVTLANAEAKNTEATAALRAAKSQTAHTASLGNATKGASSAALSFVGLRGATLAAGGAFLTGAAAVVAFGKALGSAAQFQTSLNVFQATAGATADQMERINQVAKDLGADLTLPGVTANSAADALSGLARAGLSVEASISGVRGVLQLATAAAISNEDAVNIVASALNAFSLSGKDAARVADLLAASSKESQGSITDVGLALQQSAAAAAQAGVSVEDTIALLTELGRAGLKGSDAGTSLRVALLRLIAPTKQAKEALDGLGVAIRDETGNVRPEAFTEISKALSGVTKSQQDATLALIFGQDAFRAASIIGREGADGLDRMRDSTQQAGAAAELAGARTQGLAGSMENLKNQLSTLGLSIGQGLSTPLGDFADIVAGGVQNINEFVGWLGRIGQEAPRTEKSVAGLADEFARLNREAGGAGSLDAATKRVSELGRPAAIAVLDYAELTKELGKLSFALEALKEQGASLDTPGARRLASDIADLIVLLNATEPAGLKAAAGIEEFRSGITATAIELERIKNAIEPPAGFLPKQPVVPDTGPKAIGPDVTRQAKIQVAQSRSDLAEVARLQQLVLDDANKAVENGIHKSRDARIKLVQEQAAAQAALNQTRAQIASQQAAADQKAASDAEKAAARATQAFLQSQENARTAQERLVSRAGDTPGLRDDIQRQQQLHDLLQRQITALKAAKADDKAKQAALRELRKARDGTTDEIVRLRAADEKERQANKQEALAAQQAIAAAEGNIPGQIRFINLQIAAIQKLVDAKKNEQKSLFVLKGVHEGLLKAGNIDLLHRPAVKNPLTGGTSSVFSTSVGIEGGKELLLSRVIGKGKNARVVSVEEALANFKKTGEFLGIFNTVEAANKYAAALHKEQANLFKASKLVGAERAKALESIATFVSQREALQNQQIQEKIALAESIQELTGNKNPLLKALDAAVAETRQDIAAAKKAGKSTVVLQTELNNFLAQRKKLLEEADTDTTGGTTLVDLFNKAQDILGGSGNVGQTAQSLRDLSANTQIKAQVQQRLDIVNDPAKAAAARQVASTDRLIVAIDLLTQTLTGNTASGTPITRGERNSFKNLSQEQRFFYQKQARLMVEQGLVG